MLSLLGQSAVQVIKWLAMERAKSIYSSSEKAQFIE